MKSAHFFIFCFLFVLLSSFFWHETEGWKKSKQTLLPTGFAAFDNLYFDNYQRTFFTLGEDIDFEKAVNIHDDRGYEWRKYHKMPSSYTKEIRPGGTAVILCERSGSPEHYTHFFHSLEHFLGLWNFGGEKLRDQVKLFLIAGNGSMKNLDHWKGIANDTTFHMIRALFPHAEIKLWGDFVRETQNQLVLFDKVVISDRSMEVFRKEPYNTERLLGGYFEALTKKSLDHMAECVQEYCEVEKKASDKLVVTYVQRLARRYLKAEQEKELLQRISELDHIELRTVDFAAIPFKEQVNVAANTDVLLGVHGNGLSHTLFLPKGATLIELFPKNSFRVEYRIFAKARNLNYYGWVEGRGWIDDATVSRLGCHGEVFVYEVQTNVDALINLLKSLRK